MLELMDISTEDLLVELEGIAQRISPAISVSATTDNGFYFDLWWHEPSLNVGWYPIIQIDNSEKTIYYHAGAENPELWAKSLELAMNFIRTNL